MTAALDGGVSSFLHRYNSRQSHSYTH